MKLQITCDYCGKVIERTPAQIKGKKHHFCCRRCLADYSSKERNPEGYRDLKDFTNIGRHFADLNRELNPTRMTPEIREKIRDAHLGSGEGKTYTKLHGVHEHRIVAERKLGRPLKKGEVVHHMDGNKRNNSPENIVVFASQADHVRFHTEMNWFLNELRKLDEEGGDAT